MKNNRPQNSTNSKHKKHEENHTKAHHIKILKASCKEKNPKRSQRGVKTLLFQAQKLKEFINSKQTLQEMLKEALEEDRKRPRWKPRYTRRNGEHWKW